ncbi:hypothetical protein OG871_38255 [Kitasatospora sp. NBC_00374]|uniref:hypothetical protein n=1 Tax=Kitasatospora sp. NBC_00374 TaxID=2975964 RepID=UPI0030E445B7
MDGGEAEQQRIRDTGTSVDRAKASTVTAASAGVMLLLEIGAAHPELAVSGPALTDQGAALDRRLANGWAPEFLRTAVTAHPKNEPIRNAAAILAYRISTLPETPGIPPGHGAAGATIPAVAVPRPRSVQQEIQNRAQHECQGRDGFCGRQVPVRAPCAHPAESRAQRLAGGVRQSPHAWTAGAGHASRTQRMPRCPGAPTAAAARRYAATAAVRPATRRRRTVKRTSTN